MSRIIERLIEVKPSKKDKFISAYRRRLDELSKPYNRELTGEEIDKFIEYLKGNTESFIFSSSNRNSKVYRTEGLRVALRSVSDMFYVMARNNVNAADIIKFWNIVDNTVSRFIYSQ